MAYLDEVTYVMRITLLHDRDLQSKWETRLTFVPSVSLIQCVTRVWWREEINANFPVEHFNFAGPVANALALRFTSRRVVMLGGLIMTIGFILSMFPPNIAYLYFSYGLLVGKALNYFYVCNACCRQVLEAGNRHLPKKCLPVASDPIHPRASALVGKLVGLFCN